MTTRSSEYRLLHVTKESTGRAKRYRWLLQADFDKKHGFTPMFGEVVNSPWDEALVVLTPGGHIAAAMRYDLRPKTKAIQAGGTWVAPEERGAGLAQRLWKRALRGVKSVEVTTVSRGGQGLVASLRAQYKRVSWVVNVD